MSTIPEDLIELDLRGLSSSGTFIAVVVTSRVPKFKPGDNVCVLYKDLSFMAPIHAKAEDVDHCHSTHTYTSAYVK